MYSIESAYFAHDVTGPLILHMNDTHICCFVNRFYHFISGLLHIHYVARIVMYSTLSGDCT